MKDKNNQKLSREAAEFAREFAAAGAPQSFFSTFAGEQSNKEKRAILLAMAASLFNSRSELSSFFTPIALHWQLPAVEQKCVDMRFLNEQVQGELFGSAFNLLQYQPAYNTTDVLVFENKRPEMFCEIIQHLSRYKAPLERTEKWITDHNLGIGLAQAEFVLKEILFDPQRIAGVPLFGENHLGRSVFVLLDYTGFRTLEDVCGTPRLSSLVELRPLTAAPSQRGKRLNVTFHDKLRVIIPEKSRIVMANVSWFDPEQ